MSIIVSTWKTWNYILSSTIFQRMFLIFFSRYSVSKINSNFVPKLYNWKLFSDLKGKDVVGMKKMLYKECAAWIACRQLLPAIALAAALAWLSAASYIASWIHPLYLRLVTLAFTIKALKVATNSRQLPFLNPHCFDLTRISFKICVFLDFGWKQRKILMSLVC